MNQMLKQRLIGALILLALGVVFWPIIFVEPGGPSGDEQARIPPRPGVDTAPVPAPDLAGLRASPEIEARRPGTGDAAAPAPAAEPAPPVTGGLDDPPADPVDPANQPPAAEAAQRTRLQAPEKPALDSDGIPLAWILQVASVSSAETADQLRRRLLAMDHKAYVKRIVRGDKALYRVYVGPKFERARLEEIRGAIDAEFGVQSMIIRYVP